MGFTIYTAAAVLNAIFGKTSAFGAMASAPTIHVALSSTAPNESGGNVTEPSAGGYARVATAAVDWGAASAADPSVIANAAEVIFPAATADWLAAASLTHFALYDAASAGNCLGSGELIDPDTDAPAPRAVLKGDTILFPIGALIVTLD